MEEMNHFSHKDHPLKLIENWETIKGGGTGGDDDEKKVVHCYGCQEPISGGSAYGCIPCHYFLHKTCTQTEPDINHHLHFQHRLKLIARDPCSRWNCDVCGHQGLVGGFSYHCLPCDFDTCMKCAIVEIALKEAADVKFEHEGHPQHLLTLQLRPAAFLCDACRTDDKDLFYRCNNCTFWIHKTCATSAPDINLPHHHHHPLLLAYSLPDRFYNFKYYCEFCKQTILRSYWVYHCANCRYFAHIKCALHAAEQLPTPRDGPGTSDDKEQQNGLDFLHFPMSDAFTDPLKLLNFKKAAPYDNDGVAKISHWSHNHPLILNVEAQGNMPNIDCNDPIEVCYGCVRPLSFPYYSCKDGCSFTLHKYCAELPRKLEHQLHPDHSLDLVDFEDPKFLAYECGGCFIYGNTFVYKCETCKFYLDVNCAFLPNIIKHESHKHPLVQVIDPKPVCKACDKRSKGMSYACKACNFHLDLDCAVKSPYSLAHRYCKGHQVPLTYPPVEDHLEDFYCDICEIEMHPKRWLYYCHKCDSTFHLHCIRQKDWVANYKKEGTITVSYHKHPISYVRRKKTPRYVCFGCNLDINGRLILECRTGTCPFRICIRCHNKNRKNPIT